VSHGVTTTHPALPTEDRMPRRSPLAAALLWLVRLYRSTVVLRQPRCRFHPTCSTYAVQAISTHGALQGAWLATKRVARCHPWNPGGVDHVPPRK
jgi:uncharacterized protein